MSSKALIVLSGGQDSTTCLFMAKQKHDELHCLTFNYNQRHSLEIEAARKVAEMAGATSHEVVDLGPVLKGRSFLTDHSAEVHGFSTYDEMSRRNSEKEDKLDSSFVPMRNPLFLTLAANRASVLGCAALYTGITAADFAEYGGFSWEWLGGFVDAEGHFSTINGSGFRLSISQKDPELLQRLGEWVSNQCAGLTFSIHRRANDETAELYFCKQAVEMLARQITPHLHSKHRRQQAKKVGVEVSPEKELSDAYVTGFWEGDGSAYSSMQLTRAARMKGGTSLTATFKLEMFQKEPDVLRKISEYLGRGYIHQRQTQNKIWVLTLQDGPHSAKLLNRMLPHLNVLGSFEKISKYRHRVGLLAGGFNPPYPDCTPDFLWRFQEVVDESLKTPFTERVVLEAPLLFMTKAQSIWLANKLPGVFGAMAYTHTCYAGQFPPCGKCHACLLRAYGFEQAGQPDPLMVRAHWDGLTALPETINYSRWADKISDAWTSSIADGLAHLETAIRSKQ